MYNLRNKIVIKVKVRLLGRVVHTQMLEAVEERAQRDVQLAVCEGHADACSTHSMISS